MRRGLSVAIALCCPFPTWACGSGEAPVVPAGSVTVRVVPPPAISGSWEVAITDIIYDLDAPENCWVEFLRARERGFEYPLPEDPPWFIVQDDIHITVQRYGWNRDDDPPTVRDLGEYTGTVYGSSGRFERPLPETRSDVDAATFASACPEWAEEGGVLELYQAAGADGYSLMVQDPQQQMESVNGEPDIEGRLKVRDAVLLTFTYYELTTRSWKRLDESASPTPHTR